MVFFFTLVCQRGLYIVPQTAYFWKSGEYCRLPKGCSIREPLTRLFTSSCTYSAFLLEVAFFRRTGSRIQCIQMICLLYTKITVLLPFGPRISFWNTSDTNWRRNSPTSGWYLYYSERHWKYPPCYIAM